MSTELAKALLRVAPFLLLIFAVWMAIRKGRLSSDMVVLQKPITWSRMFLWWVFFVVFIVLTE